MKPITWATVNYAVSGLLVTLAHFPGIGPYYAGFDYGGAVVMFGLGIAWSVRAALEDHDRRG